MLRLVILVGLASTAVVEYAHCQSYEDKNEDRAIRMGVATIAKGKIKITKAGDVYKVILEVEASREGQNEFAAGAAALVFLDDKCKPTFCAAFAGCQGGSIGGDSIWVFASIKSKTEINSESFEAAKGYLLIVKAESKDIPYKTPELTRFLEKEVPSWQKVVAAYKNLRPGDDSKSIGPAVVRRLR